MNITVTHAPGQTLDFAGEELHSYLGRMLPDAALRIELKTEPKPGNDAFSVALEPHGGVIAGSSPRAVLLGVYDALRRLGCRFPAPGRANELVPRIGPDALRLRYEKTGAFRHRGVCIEGADSPENIYDFIDWLPKLGYNAFFLQFKTPYAFLERWYLHKNNPSLPPEPFSAGDAERVMAQAEAEIARRGLLLHKVGHGWTGEVLGYPAVSWNADPRPLPEKLRPLAAEVSGVRDLYGGVPANTNLCLSNPDARERFAALVTDYARRNPGVDYLHIWLADTFNNVCECDACRRSTVSDQYVALLNDIDRRLTAEGLPTRLVFLLYQELLWPPVRERLENPDRFVLMFAPISRTFSRSYHTQDTPPIPPYRRNRITLPGDLGENLAFLRGWQAQFPGDSFVYDYPLGRAHYGDLGYVRIAQVIHGDIRRLNDLGLNGYISCQELRAGMPNFLPNYVMGRALFDGEAGFDALAEEYFSAAYGAAAPQALAFLRALSDHSSCDYVNGKGPRQDAGMARRMEQASALCRRFAAEPLQPCPQDDAVRAGFLERLCYHAQYAGRLAEALAALARGETENAARLRGELAGFIGQNELRFQPWLDVYRLLEITENYTGFPAI